jgi:predicted RNA-binding Zn ribbon-like protein
LRANRLIGDGEPAGTDDLTWAAEIQDALRAGVAENLGAPSDPAALATLDRAAAQTGLRVRFHDRRLQPEAGGVRGAVGTLVGIAFLARLDGSWRHLKDCGNPTCRGVFFDRSKNHSGKWCSMQTCGNRAKVRAFRERRAGRR